MNNGIQSFYKSIGEEACYFIDLIKIAEKETGFFFDLPTVTKIAAVNGWIDYDFNNMADSNNFFVNNAKEILKHLTGKDWEYTRVEGNYKAKKGEYVIRVWSYVDANGVKHSHFNMDDFDSLQASECVKQGSVSSCRVFKRVA